MTHDKFDETMKHILYTLFALTLMLFATSCDRMDDNGTFEGYWHLTECEGAALTPGTDIAWGVRNELIQFNDLRGPLSYYYATFRRTDHELQFLELCVNDGTNDTPITFDEVPEKFHIPADGRFDIITLNNHEMVLKADNVTLRFKKN